MNFAGKMNSPQIRNVPPISKWIMKGMKVNLMKWINSIYLNIYSDGLFLFREREGSLGGISQLSAMKNLEEMFSGDWQQEREEEDGEHLLDSALENVNLLEGKIRNICLIKIL